MAYMLNGYAYLGMKRVAEMLHLNDKLLSEQITQDVNALKHDIRFSLKER